MDVTGSANLLLAALALTLALVGAIAGWIASNHERVSAFLGRDRPRLARLRDRYVTRIWLLLRRYHVGGVYALSLAVAGTALAAVAITVGRYLIGIGPLPNLDERVLAEVVARREPWVTDAARLITALASFPAIAGITIGAGIVFARRAQRWLPLGLMAAATLGAEVLRMVIQPLVGRARPPAELMVIEVPGYGFPSGHAIRTIVYGAVAYLLARALRGWGAKVGVWASALFLMILVGGTRVYLGVHWPSDVLAGWAIGLLWLTAVLITAYTISKLTQPRAAPPPPPSIQRETAIRPRETAPSGLSEQEVRERVARGEVNITTARSSRTVGQIVRANVFTRFNGLLGALAAIILLTGSPRDALFGFVVVANTTIGIVQEWRAKRVLDRLQLLVAARATVLRAGAAREIPIEEIVVDDLLELASGDQIPVDGILIDVENLEVDESLLTGEAEPVMKRSGGGVLSGSFVVAGHGRAQATRVGPDAYAQRLAAEGRRFELTRSELRGGIDRILLFVTWALVPTAAVLLVSQFAAQPRVVDAIHGAIAGVVGMVPEGLVLLTSLAMALAAIRLGRRKVLVQELSAVEGLARIDVLCVDKTGTITDGTIAFERLIDASEIGSRDGDGDDARAALGALAASEPNPNASLSAIGAAFPPPEDWKPTASAAFSSARKWSGASFDGQGTWILGAPETVLARLPETDPFRTEAERIAGSGRRVIALARAHSALDTEHATLPEDLTPAALVVLSERIRPDAPDTMAYFAEQGVAVKVISGDNPRTAAAAAKAAGVPGADAEPLDARALPDDIDALADLLEGATVLGRVVPEQKRAIVGALQRRGHTVAMTGDGVNDVLALKDADLGIAMGSGTTASRAVAQVVLLGDDFAAMPGVVAEGRRLIANIERTAGLFVTKTMYVLLLALAVGVARVPFPFLPRHLTLAASLTIGIPAFLLALAPNTTRAQPGFIVRILRVAIPAGAIIAAATLAGYATARILQPEPIDAARTAAVIALTAGGWSLLVLLTRGRPREQIVVGVGVPLALGGALSIPFTRDFFALVIPSIPEFLALAGIAVATHLLLRIGERALLRARDPGAGDPAQ